MSTLATRLKSARKSANLSQAAVAERVGISQPSYQALESGKSGKSAYITQIADALNVDTSWLVTGQGDMQLSMLQSNIIPHFEPVSDWNERTPLTPDEVEVPFYKEFAVACGYGTDGVAMQDEWRKLRISRRTIDRIGSHRDKVFATTADGDSMSPTINDGDTIWVDMSKQTIKDGKIFVFEYGGLFMCKRLYRLPNDGLRVISDNDDVYPQWEMTGDERTANGFRLIGWVWHWSVMERW